MNIKIKIFILILILSNSLTQLVSAETIKGLVTQIHPVYANYKNKTPYKQCHTQQVFVPYNNSTRTTPIIAGGLVGGAIGNQFGKGRGKAISTIAGVLLGSSIASDFDYSSYGYTKNVQRCETHYFESDNTIIRGYNIDVIIPNGNVISIYKKMPYEPPPIHSQINVYITYRAGIY